LSLVKGRLGCTGPDAGSNLANHARPARFAAGHPEGGPSTLGKEVEEPVAPLRGSEGSRKDARCGIRLSCSARRGGTRCSAKEPRVAQGDAEQRAVHCRRSPALLSMRRRRRRRRRRAQCALSPDNHSPAGPKTTAPASASPSMSSSPSGKSNACFHAFAGAETACSTCRRRLPSQLPALCCPCTWCVIVCQGLQGCTGMQLTAPYWTYCGCIVATGITLTVGVKACTWTGC
jgi:hypothetical protein